MTEADIIKPMRTKGQLVAYNIINGAAETITYFVEVDDQTEIERHRTHLFKKHKLTEDYKIEFVLRQLDGAGLRC